LNFVNIVKYISLNGSSYIPLPEELQNSKKGLINIQNEDDYCFRWCHVRHLYPLESLERNPQRITKKDREFVKELDYTGINFPVTTNQISKIQKQNSININVFGYLEEDSNCFPIIISKEKYDDHMELLFIENKEEERVKQHYVYIKDFNRLMFPYTKHESKNIFACIASNAFILILI